MIDKTCLICGTAFRVIPARADTAKYCSYACLGKSKALTNAGENHKNYVQGVTREKTCEHCGKVFKQRKKEPLSNFLKKKFCSKPCADVGGFRYSGEQHPNYNPDADRQRNRGFEFYKWADAVKARDGMKCVKCGATDREVQAHHVKPWKLFPDLRYEVSNGITVCAPCHWAIHAAAENENLVNSVNPLTDGAEGNTEPSLERKFFEGVTTRGRVYRRWFGECANCKTPLSKTWSDVKNYRNVFCSKSCSATYNKAAGIIGRKKKSVHDGNSSTSAGAERHEIV